MFKTKTREREEQRDAGAASHSRQAAKAEPVQARLLFSCVRGAHSQIRFLEGMG